MSRLIVDCVASIPRAASRSRISLLAPQALPVDEVEDRRLASRLHRPVAGAHAAASASASAIALAATSTSPASIVKAAA